MTQCLIVAKLGRPGCAVLEGGVRAVPVQSIDTTGAGDSFKAGFMHAWLRKAPLRDALRFGAACRAISTLASGGTTAQATEAQAEESPKDN